MRPEVIYSIATKIGGHGLGLTSYNAVKALFEAGYLKKAVCYGNKSDIDKSKIFSLLGNPAKLLFFLPKRHYRPLRKGFIDYVTSKLILKRGCTIFHGWNNQATKSIKAAKKIKAITILDCGSTFTDYKEKLLEDEYKRFGLKFTYSPDYAKRKSIEEFYLADFIFLPSEFAKKTFIEAGFANSKLFVINRGVYLDKFIPDISKKSKKFTVLFVGRVSIRKGVQYLLQAWKELNLKDSELILAGSIDSNMKTILSRYNNIKNITFTGFLKNPIDVFQMSSIFVFPSLEEGSAKVTYEAMATGLPTITTENSGSVVRDNIDGFIIPIRNIEVIKEKILYFKENPWEIERMANNAINRVLQYTWARYRENLINTYKRILSL